MSDILIDKIDGENWFFCVNIPFSNKNIHTSEGGDISITINSFDSTRDKVLDLAQELVKATIIRKQDFYSGKDLSGIYNKVKKLIKIRDMELQVNNSTKGSSSYLIFSVSFKTKKSLTDDFLKDADAKELQQETLETLKVILDDYQKWQSAFDERASSFDPPRFYIDETLEDCTSHYDTDSNTVYFSRVEFHKLLLAYNDCMINVNALDKAAYRAKQISDSGSDESSLSIEDDVEQYQVGTGTDKPIGLLVPDIDSEQVHDSNIRLKALAQTNVGLISILPKIDKEVMSVSNEVIKIKGIYDGIIASSALVFMDLEFCKERELLMQVNKKATQCGINLHMARNFEQYVSVDESIEHQRASAYFTFTYSSMIQKFELTELEILNNKMRIIGTGQNNLDL